MPTRIGRAEDRGVQTHGKDVPLPRRSTRVAPPPRLARPRARFVLLNNGMEAVWPEKHLPNRQERGTQRRRGWRVLDWDA